MRVAGLASVMLMLMFSAFGLGATSAGQAVGAINDALTLVAYLLAVAPERRHISRS